MGLSLPLEGLAMVALVLGDPTDFRLPTWKSHGPSNVAPSLFLLWVVVWDIFLLISGAQQGTLDFKVSKEVGVC